VGPEVARPALRRRLAGEAHLHEKQVPRAPGSSRIAPSSLSSCTQRILKIQNESFHFTFVHLHCHVGCSFTGREKLLSLCLSIEMNELEKTSIAHSAVLGAIDFRREQTTIIKNHLASLKSHFCHDRKVLKNL
jgi:hypothetical protein